MTAPASVTYRHSVRVRYAEVDAQGVVFNAHYLTYCDEAVTRWWVDAGLSFGDHGWDVMVKKAVVEWAGSAGFDDVLDIDVRVSRWGTTSHDVECTGTVGGRPVFSAVITYVGVAHGTRTPMEPPDAVRALLSS
jgi:acyl-CoA thioester hydrolase